MVKKRGYELLRLDFFYLRTDDIVTTSPSFSEGDCGDEGPGMILPPVFD